ncbi:MAG: hypothetical protein ACE5FM_02055 [Methyloligellaceae bacterium]
MTQITIPLELLLTGIFGLLALGVGGTWKIVSAIAASRDALKRELKAEINELWAAHKAAGEKSDRKTDAVHKRIGDHGQRVGDLAVQVARNAGTLATILRETRNGNGGARTRGK